MSKPKNPESTAFKAEVKRQLIRLGLAEWDVTIRYGDIPAPNQDAAALTDFSVPGKVASITLNRKYRHASARKVAKHEVAHLLLARLQDLAEQRFLNERELQDCIESLCTVLEKVL